MQHACCSSKFCFNRHCTAITLTVRSTAPDCWRCAAPARFRITAASAARARTAYGFLQQPSCAAGTALLRHWRRSFLALSSASHTAALGAMLPQAFTVRCALGALMLLLPSLTTGCCLCCTLQAVWLDARKRNRQRAVGHVWRVCGPADRVCHRCELPGPDRAAAQLPGHCGCGVSGWLTMQTGMQRAMLHHALELQGTAVGGGGDGCWVRRELTVQEAMAGSRTLHSVHWFLADTWLLHAVVTRSLQHAAAHSLCSACVL